MGFDLFGVRSVSYFRNNVWWWRPLASYVVACCEIQEEGWFDNRGLEVSARKALQVADTRSALLKAGAVEAYEKQYRERLDALPEEQCRICHGTGVRSDDIVKGTCNACAGKGTVEAWARHYPSSETNVREFAAFCRESGGFIIS